MINPRPGINTTVPTTSKTPLPSEKLWRKKRRPTTSKVNTRGLLIRHLRPEPAFQHLAGRLMFAVQIVKEIEVGIVSNFGMRLQEPPKFGIIAVYVFRIRE